MIRDVIGIGVAVIVLAGFAVAIINGKETASIIGQTGTSFAQVISAATSPSRNG